MYIVTSFFNLEKISKELMYHTIYVNYEAKWKLEPEPEPGQSNGSGSSQIPQLLAAPASAPKPCFQDNRTRKEFLSWADFFGILKKFKFWQNLDQPGVVEETFLREHNPNLKFAELSSRFPCNLKSIAGLKILALCWFRDTGSVAGLGICLLFVGLKILALMLV